jgi:O-antigen/teichoic acid export membrane protein
VACALAALALDGRVSREAAPLRRLLGKTAAWSTLDVIVGRFGQFAQGVFVARLVAPRSFGVFAIALVVHTVVVNISELGVSAALIRDDPAHTSRSAPTVLTICLVTSGLLGVLIAACSPTLAAGLGSEKAAAPIAIMALNLPLAGLSAVPSALLKRDFRMERVFVADVANMLVSGVVVVVLLAFAGWGALALAWSWVAGQLATTLLLLTYRSARFRPGWSRTEARRLLAFGLPLAGANLLAFLVLSVDYIIVGRVLGAEALGIYMLAVNISGWPINVFGAVITNVSLPGFSRLRLEGVAMSEQFVRALRLVASVVLPVCLIIAALARPAVTAIYGARWSPAASALVGLCVLGAGRILLTLSADFLVSLGRTRAVMIAQVPWLVALTTALLIVAPRFGLRGVGLAQAGVVVLVMGPVYAVFLSKAGVRVRSAGRALVMPTVWALLAAAGAHGMSSIIDNDFLACVCGGVVGLAIAVLPFAATIGSYVSMAHRRGLVRAGLRGASSRPTDKVAEA